VTIVSAVMPVKQAVNASATIASVANVVPPRKTAVVVTTASAVMPVKQAANVSAKIVSAANVVRNNK
jgi:hypothetical protein